MVKTAIVYIVDLASNFFDLVGDILAEMDKSKDDKTKKGASSKSSKSTSNDSVEQKKASTAAEVPAQVPEARVEQCGGSAPLHHDQTESLTLLAQSIASITQNLKDVQTNQQDMVNVMLEAGAKPFFGKGKGRGKTSGTRGEQPPRGPGIPAKTASRRENDPPAAKRPRRDEGTVNLAYDNTDVEYSDEYDDELEYDFTSDEIETQIDEFLKTAHDVVTPPAPQVQRAAVAGPSGDPPQAAQAAQAQAQATQEEVLADVLDEGLANFAQDLATDEDVGPAVSKQLAEIMNNLLSKKLSEDKIKSRIEENPPPNNIPLLHPPRVNEAIWEVIKSGPRSGDIRMRKIQVRLTRGLSALARLADILLECKTRATAPDLTDSLNRLLQAFALLSNANYEISLRRRETLRSQLNSKYSRLCYQSTPVTSFLFGDDITKTVEDITKVQRLGANISYGGGFGGYNGNRGGGFSPNRGRGRGRGQPQYYRGRGRGDSSKNGRWRGNGKKPGGNRQ